MSYKKILSFFLLSFAINIYNAKAQSANINGDTIFVNIEAEVQIVFPTLPTSFSTIPEDNQYNIWDSRTGINLIAANESYDPVTLLVSEGGRNHRFIITYKKFISNKQAKLYYDYSTVQKIREHAHENLPAKPTELIKPVVNKESLKPQISKKADTAIALPVDTSSNYYALLEQGDKDLKLKNYLVAKLSFDKAHNLRPTELIPMQRLDLIKTRLDAIEKSAQQSDDKKYLLLTEDAKNKMDQKKFAEASKVYNMALAVKPGDSYVNQQLKTIDSLVIAGKIEKENQKNRNLLKAENALKAQKELSDQQLKLQSSYDSAVALADEFFKAGEYDNAKAYYNKALSLIKKDWPKNQLIKINKIINDQVAKVNNEKNNLVQQAKMDSAAKVIDKRKSYALAIANARTALARNELLNAKAFYEEAGNLQPSQQEPLNKLKLINTKIADSIKDAELENNYVHMISVADSLVNSKAYAQAIPVYNQAQFIKPLESYPGKQIKYLRSELVLIEARKKQEREEQYSNALTRADKDVTDKNFDDAKAGYTEALTIHPENEYAKRRLEILSYQIEKTRLEKLSQDTVREVIPLKKTKRKRSS